MSLDRRWLLVIGLVVVVIGLALLRFRSKSASDSTAGPSLIPPRLTPTVQGADPVQSFRWTGDQPELPDQLPSYQTSSLIISQSYADRLAKQFGFTGQPQILSGEIHRTTYLYQDQGSYLQIMEEPPSLSFYLPPKPSQAVSRSRSKDYYIKIAVEHLESYELIPPPFSLGLSQLTFSSSNPVGYQPDRHSPDLAVISFELKLNDLPYTRNQTAEPPVFVTTDLNGELVRLDTVLLDFDLDQKRDQQLLSFTQAWEKIKQQQGTITALSGETEELQATKPAVVALNQIQPAYLKQADQIFPIYVFQGSALSSQGEKRSIHISLPAVRIEP